VDNQKISADSMAAVTSDHGRGVASALLNRSSSSVTGSTAAVMAFLPR
jgi:hypothetical protein